MSEPDNSLIAEFNASHSEDAFAALVRQHANLVFATAFRQVGEAGAAEEITQNVFVALARSTGKLISHPTIAGWLHQTALNKSREWLRAELRRRKREQVAMNLETAHAEGGSVWAPLVPLLDEALLELREADRQAVILHYLEGRNFQEVGSLLGVGEDAARKRVGRCLDQLTNFFHRQGFATPALAAGAPLFALASPAAPVGLAASATTAGLAAHSTTSTLTLIKAALKIMSWTKANTAVAVGAVILATGTTAVVVHQVQRAPKPIHLAAGALPQTPEELNAWYVEPPAGRNGATVMLQGMKAMQIADADQNANLPVLGKLPQPDSSKPLPPEVKAALASFLQRNQDALQVLAQGRQYEQSRYPIDLTKGSDTLLPHLASIKKGGQLAQLAAMLEAENGDGRKAADDVATVLALARSLKAEPVLISQLVRAADLALAVEALNQSVNRASLPPESLSALAKMFQETEDYDARGEGFTRALVGEKVNHTALLNNRKQLLHILEAYGSNGQADAESRHVVEYVKKTPSLRAELDFFQSTFQQLMAARQDPLPDRLKEFSDLIDSRVSEARNQGLLLNAAEWTADGPAASREARCVANSRLALTGIALEQFRAAHGNHYPDGLSELIPTCLDAPLTDPFDGHPLRYRKQGAGYVLYSIGPDLKDDGGKPLTTKGGDMVFAVAAPPAN
jgi:RNA polymerase sigma factor (sigma-70 family)